MKQIYILSFVLLTSLSSWGQDAYFQQEVNTVINVTLDDQNHTLNGSIDIEYINNSPDELTEIQFLMFGNAFKDRQTAFAKQKARTGDTKFYFADDKDRGNYSNVAFTVDGKPVEWAYDKTLADIAILQLNEPLPAGGKIDIATPFTLKIPASFSRLGHVGESYQMTQWYPKPAVYDKEGWHPMPYLDMGEYYYEFGSYDVSITLPENYVVGSTGTLQTQSEIAFLDKKIAETTEYLKQDLEPTTKSVKDTFPPSSENMKTIRYTAENVHDFAWFADKRFKVQKSSVTLASGKVVETWVMFTKVEEHLWKTAIDYVDRSVKFYSEKVGEYPWPQASAVQSALSAGGGMEYPMITVIGAMGNAQSLDEVITHEVGHNWFYGILAFNERDHVWMDEGINSYYDHRYTEEFYESPGEMLPDFIMNTTDLRFGEVAYLFQARRDLDQAPQTDSDDFVSINYFLGGYEKPALVLKYLETYLGTDVYDKAMQSFYDEWKFKHPQPEDYIGHLERSTGKDLSWFFDGWIYSTDDMDYALTSAGRSAEGWQINVANKGQINAPFTISGIKDGEIVNTQWYEGFDGDQKVDFVAGEYDEFVIDAQQIALELDRRNNQIKPTGVFKKLEPLKFSFASGIENSKRTNIYYLPALGFNNYDKFMAGVGFHNYSLLEKKFEFAVFPMYGFGTGNLTGIANARLNFHPKTKAIGKITIGANAKTFSHNYNETFDYHLKHTRVAPFLKIDLGKKAKSNVFNTITLTPIFLRQQQAQFDSTGFTGLNWDNNNIYRVKYTRDNRRKINGNKLEIELEQQSYTDVFQQEQSYLKSTLTYNTNYTYAKGKNVSLRIFAGGFFQNDARERGAIFPGAISLSGEGFNEFNDYAFDDFYFNRNGELPNQITMRGGGFKRAYGAAQAANAGATNDLMIAFNLKADLPKRLPLGLPIKPYFDIAYSSDAKPTGDGKEFSDQLWYSAGIMLEINKVGAVYFPIPGLEPAHMKAIDTGNYFSKITFTLDIKEWNPVELVEKFSF